VDHHFFILWMYIFFHNYIAPKYLKHNMLTVFRHISIKIFAFRHFPVETSFSGVFYMTAHWGNGNHCNLNYFVIL
jgi:hypothetical protein